MPKLTKTIVDRAELRSKQYALWCSELKGFGCYIHPTGKRTYLVDYRNADGVRRRMTIGPHGVLTTEEARKLALGYLGDSVRHEDPLLERRTRRSSLTVSELCDRYLKAAERGLILGRKGLPKKASTLASDIGRIERHIKPILGHKLVIDVGRMDIAKFIREVSVGKTAVREKSGKLRGLARVTGGTGVAARSAGLLGGIFSFAVSEGVIEVNPASGVVKPAGKRRERRLSADEYKAFGDALRAVEADGVEPWQATLSLRLIALTGCRLGEIAALKWSEVDRAGHALRLGDSKTGKSVRPLPAPAARLFDGIDPVEDNPYVFPAPRNEGSFYAGTKTFYRRLFKRAGLAGVTPHVLRHSFASIGADLGFTDSTIGAILGHAGTTITSRYVHHLDTILLAGANKIAAEVSRQMAGTKPKGVTRPGDDDRRGDDRGG